MGVPTYLPIANITLGSTAASVTFSGITQQYRDLVLVVNGQSSGGANLQLFFNDDFGANYFYAVMYGQGSGSGSSFAGTGNEFGTIYASDSVSTLQIMDYSAIDKHKTTLTRANNAANIVMAECTRWANTAAITKIRVNPSSGTFSTGSSFALYGVLA